MKTKLDNNVTNCTDAIYIKNETKLSWPIELGVISDANQTRQWRDRSYRCSLRQKRNWATIFYWNKCGLWRKIDRTVTLLIVQVQSTSKMKQNCHDRSGRVQTMTKTTFGNDMTDYKGVGYVENKTKKLWPIGQSMIYDENNIGQRRDQSYRCSLH